MIPDEVISQIRERTDIVALIGDYVELKRAGASYRGLCPFHAEKTPSFYVHPVRGFYHCFGCQQSGDALSFVMALESHSFPTAARMLAERAGIELSETESWEDEATRRQRAQRERYYAITDAAAAFFRQQLGSHPQSDAAREELARRGVTDETAETFRLGYAPASWDGLVRLLRQRDMSLRDAEAVGLVAQRRDGSGYYDRFRHRLMFPVSDVHGRVVAFSGRALEGGPGAGRGDPPPKYVNSPEGPLYKKGELLFGLHQARVDMRRAGEAVLCEGNFDLLALHQAGIRHAVAPLGTALTATQAKWVRRFASRATLIFDGDRAGAKAVRAAFPLLDDAGLSGRVAWLPSGQDPDTFVREHGSEALEALLKDSVGIIEALIDDAAAQVSGADARQVAEAIEALAPIVSRASPVERDMHIERIGQRFGIRDPGVVRAQLRRGFRAQGVAARASGHAVERAEKRAELPKREKEVFGVFLDNPDFFASEYKESLEQLLTSPALRVMFHATCAHIRDTGGLDATRLLSELGDVEGRVWLEERLSRPQYDADEARELLDNGLRLLAKDNIERERRRLDRQITDARSQGDEARAIELTRRRDQLGRSAQGAFRDKG